jgi:alpha-beta hydrolase superfamily lysophospholipase
LSSSDHVCERFLKHGYDFYALDMRKCGRSVISPEHDQYKHYCNDLREYDEEITLAIEHIIKQTKITDRKILLFGHSTGKKKTNSRFYSRIVRLGGLIATFYARSGSRRADVDALILNSPFLAVVETNLIESALMKIMIKLRRSQDVDAGWYGRSIHVSHRGEWDFDLGKKPIDRVRLHGPFFSAVQTVQKDLIERRIPIECPILFMCSNRFIKPGKTWRDEYAEGNQSQNISNIINPF